jgi:hypothetical protein
VKINALIQFDETMARASESDPNFTMDKVPGGFVRLVITSTQVPWRCTLLLAPADAEKFGCAWIVAAHGAERERQQVESVMDAAERPTKPGLVREIVAEEEKGDDEDDDDNGADPNGDEDEQVP